MKVYFKLLMTSLMLSSWMTQIKADGSLSSTLPDVRVALQVINNTNHNLLLLEYDYEHFTNKSETKRIGTVGKKNQAHVSSVDIPYNRFGDKFETRIYLFDPEEEKNKQSNALLLLTAWKNGNSVTLVGELSKNIVSNNEPKFVSVDKDTVEVNLLDGPVTFLVTVRINENAPFNMEIITNQELKASQREAQAHPGL